MSYDSQSVTTQRWDLGWMKATFQWRFDDGLCRVCFRWIVISLMIHVCVRSFATPVASLQRRSIKHRVVDATRTYLAAAAVERVNVVGGGLAGLSVTYHLLQKSDTPLQIAITDIAPVGTGGASAVSGGLMHPLSPRGKLVHWGLEGLIATNRLVQAAEEATTDSAGTDQSDEDRIVLCREFYRIAETDEHVAQLQQTAATLGEQVQWRDSDEIYHRTGCNALGGLQLYNGCCVLHVPSYLKSLWKACQDLAIERNSTVSWTVVGHCQSTAKLTPGTCDVTVYCGGAGMLTPSKVNRTVLLAREQDESVTFPVQLVRGQSLEIRLPEPLAAAVLCGKYVSPLPNDPFRALVGATHEFQTEPLSQSDVVAELQRRTGAISSLDWTKAVVENVTSGYRVQSVRGKYGRRPIIGKLPSNPPDGSSAWILTGLGSRGLLYHGLYGEMLADAILAQSEDSLLERCPDMLWWNEKALR